MSDVDLIPYYGTYGKRILGNTYYVLSLIPGTHNLSLAPKARVTNG
jgi:hypothetical protein